MATNLALDDTLIDEARRIGKHKTKKEAVNAALTEYIARHKQLEILQYFGKLEYQEDYDYKKLRSRR
jgi:Arc/MetJ family transcription regulator